MDLYHKILAGVVVAVVAAAGFLGYQWLGAHDAALRAEAQVAADQQQLKKLDQQQADLAAAVKQLQADNARQLADLSRTFAAAQTPAQLAALLSKTLGQPVIVRDAPAPTAANPTPAPTVELPDAPKFKAYVADCEACKLSYANAQQALANAAKQHDLDAQRLALKDDQVAQLQRAAGKRPWLVRAGRRVGAFVVDAGIVALVACGTGHCR